MVGGADLYKECAVAGTRKNTKLSQRFCIC